MFDGSRQDSFNRIEEFIERNCFFTGSRAYGLKNRIETDYDYICSPLAMYTRIRDMVKDHKISLALTDSVYFNHSFYFSMGNKQYNIICLPQKEFVIWVKITKIFKALVDGGMGSTIKRKRDRIQLFETLKVIYRFQ